MFLQTILLNIFNSYSSIKNLKNATCNDFDSDIQPDLRIYRII